MPLSTLTATAVSATVLAQNGGEAPAGGFDPFLLIMLAVFGLLIFFMFRRSKKAQEQQQTMRQGVRPGVEVMTSMGLFGTVLSVDQDNNKVVLELSPGSTATVHMQAIGQVVDSSSGQAPAEAEGFVAPADVSELDSDADRPGAGPAGPAGPSGPDVSGPRPGDIDPQDPRPGTDRPQP